jgi:outer membrane protein TolC
MRLLRVLLALAVAGAAALAQTNGPVNGQVLSLQDCIQFALQSNLDLQIDRYNPKIALYALNGAYGGYDPTFNLSGEHDHRESGSQVLGGGFIIPSSVLDDNSFNSSLGGLSPWGTTYSLQGNITDEYGSSGGGPFKNTVGSASFTLDQPLLKNFWIDSTRLTIRIAKNRLQYSELLFKLQIMQTITTLEQAYYDLIYDRENVEVQEKAVELAERLVVENKERLRVGTLAPLDLQSAEAQAATSRAAVIAAQNTAGTQERLVKQLISSDYTRWANVRLIPSGSLTAISQAPNVQDGWSKALTQRPDLLQAKLDVEKQGIQLKYDKNQLYPQLDAFGTYGYNGSGDQFSSALYDIQQTDKRFYTYGGKITLPLANVGARNTVKSDKATLQQLILTLKKLEQSIMVTVDNDVWALRSAYNQVEATRAAREYEEAALDAEQKKLENGKSTTYTVLQVQRDLTTARGTEIQALDTYNKSISQLSLDEASTLTRLSIDLDVK